MNNKSLKTKVDKLKEDFQLTDYEALDIAIKVEKKLTFDKAYFIENREGEQVPILSSINLAIETMT